ncbi:MAG: transporter substrate-binding domain-containing protein [Holophaga sp.]|nr:transporter substrate-binding domain-containing protein [Holophaga sp.]
MMFGMKRKIAAFCTGLLLPVLMGGALRAETGVAAIKQKGTLVVGTATGYYPFEMVDKQNVLVGFDIDVAKAIAKDLGVKLEWQNYAFSGLIPAMQSKKVDLVIAGMTGTDKRKEVVDFTVPYFTSGQALLVNKNVPNIKKWQDLDKKGWVIAVSQGTTADTTATKMFKNATVKKFDGSALAGLELLNGHAQAVIHEVPWVAIYQRMNPTQTYAVLEPFTTELLSVAVPKGNPQLVDHLNGFLAKYVKSSEYAKTYKYWFVTMDWWNGVPLKK